MKRLSQTPKSVTKYALNQSYIASIDGVKNQNAWTFQYPGEWTALYSPNKGIALQRIRCIPKSYRVAFELKACVRDTINGIEKDDHFTDITGFYTTENTIEEIITDLQRKMNDEANALFVDEQFPDFDPSTVNIVFDCMRQENGLYEVYFETENEDRVGAIKYVVFIQIRESKSDPIGWKNFLRLFNQPLTIKQFPSDAKFAAGDNPHLVDVWDRRVVYFHSDIAHGTNNMRLGINGESYDRPSKNYQATNHSNIFSIWTSFNGKDKAELLHEDFEVWFWFIADIENNNSN